MVGLREGHGSLEAGDSGLAGFHQRPKSFVVQSANQIAL